MVTHGDAIILRSRLTILLACVLLCAVTTPTARAENLFPKHLDARSQKAIDTGLQYLAKTQGQDGNWNGTPDTAAYPVTMTSLAGLAFLANGNTPSRGPYAENVKRAELWLIANARPSGIITNA